MGGIVHKAIAFTLAPVLAFTGAVPAYAADGEDMAVREAVVAAAAATEASAQEPAEPAEESDDGGWEVALVPYIWASAMKVDVDTPQGENIELDESFTDILSSIKFVFMGALDARKGRFVTLNDLIFLSTGSETDGTIGPIPLEVEADMKSTVATSTVGYRAVDKGPMYLDIMAGARISSISVDLDVTAPLNSYERDNSKTKISPVIATRARVPLGKNWGFAMYGDVGGFGIGSTSWQLLGSVQHDVSKHWRLGAGWRHFVVLHNKGKFDVDLTLTGPFFTAAYRF